MGLQLSGSVQLEGNLLVTGSVNSVFENVLVTGTLVAQEIETQLVSSSIIYSSGSNKFGDLITDKQQFTGSLQVSGSSHTTIGTQRNIGNQIISGSVTISGSITQVGVGSSNTSINTNSTIVGVDNTFFGKDAAVSQPSGSNNTYVGAFAGSTPPLAGDHSRNTFVGSLAGANHGGNNNSYFGWKTGINSQGGENSFFGSEAGFYNAAGTSNSFFGASAGVYTGFGVAGNQAFFNSFFGAYAGYSNTSGARNTFLGTSAGYGNQQASRNVLIGEAAGYYNVNGSDNTVIGHYAGTFIGSGAAATSISSSVLIGRETRPAADSQVNQIVIGHLAVGNGSNTVTLGNDSITATYLKGNVATANGNISILRTSGGASFIAETTATNGEATLTLTGKNSSGTVRSSILKYDNADVLRLGSASPIPIQFETNDVARITIASGISSGDGSVTINTGNLVIGTSGKGIDFSATSNGSGTTSSELLNDYEEGTWTPVIGGTGGESGQTYSGVQSGHYTKVGRIVTVTFRVVLSDKGTITDNAAIKGLPFTIKTDGNSYGAGVTYFEGLATSWSSIFLMATGGETYATIDGIKTAATLTTRATTSDIGNSTQFNGSFTYFV